jgi:phage repressor protein C with HTH and peptisase S24 domain
MRFTKVMNRVSSVIEKDIQRKPFDKDIAQALGIAAAQYSNNKKNQNIPSLKIIEYCASKGVNINWVFLGHGAQKIENINEDVSKIKIMNSVHVSAGGGAYNEEGEDMSYLSIDNVFLEKLGVLYENNIEAINVVGDSMEPVLNDESIVLINRNKTDIGNGGIFVVNTRGGLLVKRVSMASRGMLDLISDNKLYNTISVPMEEASIVGKVIGTMSKM